MNIALVILILNNVQFNNNNNSYYLLLLLLLISAIAVTILYVLENSSITKLAISAEHQDHWKLESSSSRRGLLMPLSIISESDYMHILHIMCTLGKL